MVPLFLCATAYAAANIAVDPIRLTINGSMLLHPDGSPFRLTGFNWVTTVHTPAQNEGGAYKFSKKLPDLTNST